MEVRGSAAIVTGGASGLGKATAKMLAAKGAKVAIFDLNEEVGQAAATEIGGAFFKVNVADEESANAGFAAAEAAYGPAQLLINCAGVAPAIRIVNKDGVAHPLEAYRKTIEVNLIGTFNMISKFAARLIATRIEGEEAGVIVNTASVAAYDGQVG